MVQMTAFHGDLVDSAGVAKRFAVEIDTVRKWVQRGLLRPKGTIGRAYLFDQKEVDRFSAVKRTPGNPLFQQGRAG
jgi:predicted site-specific integrase-resolvase